MSTYKVIQDIEAEDKLIGWMTPRQAIYAAIVFVSLFIGFMLFSNGVWWLALPMLPHIILFSVLSGPFVHDQPSEVWLLAKIKFFLKPRRRIWDQSGLKELVTITVPKKIERTLTDGLSQNEVRSRLQALANTIDSRGWAVKNINTNLYAQPSYVGASSDRLLDHTSLPQEVPTYEILPSDDILDEHSNPTAQHMQQMINQSTQAHRQQIMSQMQQPQQSSTAPATPQPDYWFVDPSTQGVTPQAQPAAIPDSSDEAIMEQIQRQKSQSNMRNMRGISPLPPVGALSPTPNPQPVAQPATNQAVVTQLAQNNDLNISTIARQANKQDPDDEVVISLR